MKHIELLTMESYIREKREIVENIGYTLKELHIDHVENIDEIIKQIAEEYFEHRGSEKGELILLRRKGSYLEIGVSNSCCCLQEAYFLQDLKDRYMELLKNGKDEKIVDEIERILQEVFEYSSRWLDSIEIRMYEIIKYTLTKEEKCDYLDNGKFISEMGDNDLYPFENVDDRLPIFCQAMQQVLFGVHRRIFINPKNSLSEDITKFSFYNTKKIIREIIESLERSENREDYKEGAEDFLLLDRILGISLTNIIYWKTKEITDREKQDEIIGTVCQLGKCHCLVERNLIAQVLLDYLKATEYNKNIMQRIESSLSKDIRVWNEYYEEMEAVALCSVFMGVEKCSVNDLIEACEIIEDGKAWDKYIYLDEIVDDDIMDESKIRIPKKAMNNRTWYAYIHKAIFEAIWS